MVTERSGGPVRAELTVEGQDGTATLDLYHWLRNDHGVRAHAELSLVHDPGNHTAMGALEIISLVLGQGIAAANLGLAYAAWRAARPTAPPLSVTVDGRQITVRGGSEEDVARLVRALTGADQDESRRGDENEEG